MISSEKKKNFIKEVSFEIPMYGNAFRVYIDREHSTHHTYQGRFDFQVEALEFDPRTS